MRNKKNAPEQPSNFVSNGSSLPKSKGSIHEYTGFKRFGLVPRRVTLSTLERPGVVIIVNGRIREWLRQKFRNQPTARAGGGDSLQT
jgi:hypothetical protein